MIRAVTPRDLWRYTRHARHTGFAVAEGLFARGWITGMGKVTKEGGEVLGVYLLQRQVSELSEATRRAVLAVEASPDAAEKLRPSVRGALRLRGWLGPKGLTRKGREIAALLVGP
jgi:hypothetical protein